jgi:hypothetical protein
LSTIWRSKIQPKKRRLAFGAHSPFRPHALSPFRFFPLGRAGKKWQKYPPLL